MGFVGLIKPYNLKDYIMFLTSDLNRYNKLVTPAYKLNAEQFNNMVSEVFESTVNEDDLPCYEIPSNETKSGQAETFPLIIV